ncbi:MAG TPA: class I SAM-dependent methyltransferase [Pseudonocardiaceae bacterium]
MTIMPALSALLIWLPTETSQGALRKALVRVRQRLKEHGYTLEEWSDPSDGRRLDDETQARIQRVDLVIDAGGGQPFVSGEVGFAIARSIPVVLVRQEGMPSDGIGDTLPRRIHRYPQDVSDDKGFERFEKLLDSHLRTLAESVLTPGYRALRRARNHLIATFQEFFTDYPGEHPQLHLLSGWANALAEEMHAGGTARMETDSDYYLPTFSALRGWAGGKVRAIADLTDNTETFWKPEHPEMMSAPVTERIFLINWQLFFENEPELTRYIEQWRLHKESHRDREYEIYIATKDPRDDVRHPFAPSAVGHHMLLINPDVIGGYIRRYSRDERRLLVIEHDRGEKMLFDTAEQFYNMVKARAVRFDPAYGFLELKRQWLAKTRIGQWDPEWTTATEERSAHYFDRYDQHIRCWIPFYDQMLADCAASVESEIVRIVRSFPESQVELLEIGYGTGNLTERLAPWIETFNRPFEEPGERPPVRVYDGVDRAGRMKDQAERRLAVNQRQYLHMRLQTRTAWDDVSDDDTYDIIFGSLIMHFLIGANPAADVLDRFFHDCQTHLRDGGSLVFADAFDSDLVSTESTTTKWRDWMIRHGLSAAHADNFLAGNQDMVQAASVEQLEKAAAEHHFRLTKRKKYVGPFQLLVFQREG